MRRAPILWRLAAAGLVAAAAATTYVLACGPFLSDLKPIETVVPPHMDRYAGGHLGVVRPRFARRYLVQAYRRFSGRAPLPSVDPAWVPVPPGASADANFDVQRAIDDWTKARAAVAGEGPRVGSTRRLERYQHFDNCLVDTFQSAVRTLQARVAQHGASSPRVRDWIEAQDTVFANCEDGVAVPPPAPVSADTAARADRDYQIAAAHFYAMHFDDAARLFRAIAADRASPWRRYGHYLAARALIRKATIPDQALPEAFVEAERELRQTLADRDAAPLHAAARGLLDLVALRSRSLQRLHELSAVLAGPETAGDQQLADYQFLMDRLLGNVTTFEYANVSDREEMARGDDLSDWIITMQGEGPAAAARALARWKSAGSAPWLVAALWKTPPAATETPGLLEAASRVDAASPAFPTVAFLRVRALIALGRDDEARAVLTAIPAAALDAAGAETANLVRAQRFRLARDMKELLNAAPRVPVSLRTEGMSEPEPPESFATLPVFDDDAAGVFSRRMPLARMVEAATSPALPDRLRLRIAAAAFARAWLLQREADALAVAPVIRSLSPSLADDMRRYESAGSPRDRYLAGLRLLLRTPGIRATVKGVEDHLDAGQKELPRVFDHTFRRNWWCGFGGRGETDALAPEYSPLLALVYPDGAVPFPSFLTADERAATDRERAALAARGTAPNHLAREAVKWATERPADLDAAEGLAHAVEGTRWGCADATTTAASRAAFTTLHKLFPRSEWARKTRYWY